MRLVILFGSRARGTAAANSDVDVAVWSESPLALADRTLLAAKLSQQFRVAEDKIDIVDLARASPLLQKQVADTGRLLGGNPQEFLRFRVLAWKRYQDTAKLRRARERALAQHYDK